ncbi:MAG: ribonucleoside triphosphate reductase [Opitutales bacterium]|nr:ribonucleoside triphosphate reductase [Opitutales bacterium]
MISQTLSQKVKFDTTIEPEDVLRSQVYQMFLEIGTTTEEFGSEVAEQLTDAVFVQLGAAHADTLSELENTIETVLLQSPYHKSAKHAILVRDRRNRTADLVKEAEIEKVDQYLSKLDWEVRENSNMRYSLQGLNQYLAGSISKTYWLNKVYPQAVREAYESGDFHLHDLSQLSVYCVGWDLADLLKEGFGGVHGKLESKPAKHFRTALGQVVNFFYTLQGEAAGAQAFSNFDTLLAPFIRFDGLTEEQVEQALQEFVFNINVPTRVGFQTPFTNVTLDLFCPAHLKNEPVIIGGKLQEQKYGEFQKEIDLFDRAFFKVLAQGDAKGRVMTFPIPTISVTRDFDWDSENLKGLWEITGKYGIPYFSNFVNSDMNPEDVRSMCCRLRIDNTQLWRKGGGLFGANPLTGSVGIVTINLPRLGFLSATKGEFFDRLTKLMVLAKESLEIKRALLEKLTDAGLYPYTSFYLKSIKQRFGCYWSNHFSTIGIVGMNEACLNLLNKSITTEEGRQFALEVLDYMRSKMVEFQQETGNYYNLEATPAEGASFSLALKDQKQFGGAVRSASESETPYYTNSIHVPVNYTNDLFQVLDHQDELQTKFTGGTVVHCFLGERIRDGEVVKNLVRKIAESYKLPYFSLTPTFSICAEHGYLAGEQKKCPHCGGKTEVYSRVVGYLQPVQQWNDGKQTEFAMRKMLRFDGCPRCAAM